MDEQRPQQKNPAIGCLKITAVGCLVVFFGLIALGVLMIVNRDSIRNSSWFREASEGYSDAHEEMTSLIEMNDEIRNHYPADEVNIGRESRSDGSGAALKVNFRNPEFEIGEAESKAREIASFINSQYSDGRYSKIEIVFGSGTSEGMDMALERSYSFTSSELGSVDLPTDDADDSTSDAVGSDSETEIIEKPEPQGEF